MTTHVKSRQLSLFLVAVGLLGVAGCGGGSSPSVVSSTSLTPSQSTASATTAAPTSAAPSTASPSSSAASPGGQTVSISPSTGLSTGTTVHVTGVGFTPNSPLVVNECADKGASTGPGDCNLEGMVATTADATGKVSVDYVVTAGPFGANNIVCGPAQQCLLSISQAVPTPTEEASVSLTFK